MEKNLLDNLSYSSLDMRRKTMVAFAIVSILPVLISFYLLYDKVLGGSRRVSTFLFIATLLSMMGLFLFIEIIRQVVKSQ
jgi:ABC-type protease/lipase transport system fused ATPase/permease subunit